MITVTAKGNFAYLFLKALLKEKGILRVGLWRESQRIDTTWLGQREYS